MAGMIYLTAEAMACLGGVESTCRDEFLQPGLNLTVKALTEAVRLHSASFLQPGLVHIDEAMTCLKEEEISNFCSASTYPVMSNSFMLFMMLVYYLAITPLSSTTETRLSLPEMGAYFGLQNRTKFQLFALQVIVILNIILFTSIDKGEIKTTYKNLWYVAMGAQVIILLTELHAIMNSVSRRARHGDETIDRVTNEREDQVAEFMEGVVERGS